MMMGSPGTSFCLQFLLVTISPLRAPLAALSDPPPVTGSSVATYFHVVAVAHEAMCSWDGAGGGGLGGGGGGV
jgi:hypothetical protein